MKILVVILILIAGGICGYFSRPLGREGKEVRQKLTMETLAQVTGKKFRFASLIEDTCGVAIITPDESHQPLLDHISTSAQKVSNLMSQADSPARQKRRINEVSSLFEEALLQEISAHPDFTCDFPKTKDGHTQRSGYPDLRVEHLPTKTIAYLDPKLFEDSSLTSTFRTFYYEPSPEHSKVTEDALHLLIGFPHDGQTQAWTFGTPKLVDLSQLEVTLKAEFSASNRDLYHDPKNN